MDAAAVGPRQHPERDWLPVETLGEHHACLGQLPLWFKTEGMSPPGAIPLQHVQGAARQASSARKTSQARDEAFPKYP